MKKLLIAALLTVAVNVLAIDWKIDSFLNVPSVTTSNLVSVTNLQSALYSASMNTNITGLVITNKANNRVIVGVSTNFDGSLVSQYENLLATLPFSPLLQPIKYVDTNNTTWGYQGNAAIVVSCTGGASANVANTLKFTPLFDGINAGTVAGESLSLAVTPNGATRVTIRTNINLATQFYNCRAIRLEAITPGDTDAASQVVWDTIKLIQIVP